MAPAPLSLYSSKKSVIKNNNQRAGRGSDLAIPFKKTDTRLVPYLLRDELQAVLDAPDPATRDGIRDRAMLHVAVC
ncbi:MAG TPA: hypothetical protein VHT00_23925, partial [Stellaceae bacterium]|nr:hypothetical protein [Stellaceae bacterium]